MEKGQVYWLNFPAKTPKRSPPNFSCKYRNEQDNKSQYALHFYNSKVSTGFQEVLQDPDSNYLWMVRQELTING